MTEAQSEPFENCVLYKAKTKSQSSTKTKAFKKIKINASTLPKIPFILHLKAHFLLFIYIKLYLAHAKID